MRRRFLFLILLLLCCSSLLKARVERVEISSRADVLNGKSFGDAGAYERIVGRVYFSIPIQNPHNHRIVDLADAVNLKDGEVEFSADFIAIKPKDASKSNGSLLLEIPNRGRGRIVALVDGGNWDLASDAGDAWLLRNGYTIVSLGWQWDASGADALKLYAPIAKHEGKTIAGFLRGDLMPSKVMQEIPLGHLILGNIGGTEYPVAAPEDSRNVLSVRDSRNAKRVAIPRSEWQFAHTVGGKLESSDRFIHLNSGFQPGKIYEYVYAVADPVIAGLGFAAVRDFAAYAKHSKVAVTPAARAYGQGISQNGRFLRDFLYEGFNADEDGRIALDGVLAHVAGAGRGSFNYRFAQPSRDAQPTSSVFFPTDIFPFSDLPEVDPATGNKEGLLDRATADKVVPRIFLSNTSYEYWGRAAALIHTTADGKHDTSISPNVRIYHFTGLQHFSVPFPPVKGEGDLLGQQPESPLPIKYFWRSMIANMDTWVRSGTLPPESSYPKIADGNLVPLKDYSFPSIPGVHKPHEANEAFHLDFGQHWRDGVLSVQPPHVEKPFPVLVPQVDADGNERDGVRLPEITVPLATYTGWNLRDPSIGAPDQRVAFEASYLPFPKTEFERKISGDPRKSIAERYVMRENYLRQYSQALDNLVKQRWILEEDRSALIHRGEQEWDELFGSAKAHADILRGAYGPYRANNDLLYYHLDVRVDPEKKFISGKNTIRFKMLQDGKRIQLDLTDALQIDKILLGSTTLKYERDSGAVFVDFPETLRAGKTYSIDFYYSGHPVEAGRFGSISFKKDSSGHTWINTACEELGASTWWPDKDQWRDEVENMDISVAIPNDLVDVSNGKFVGKKDLGDGYTRWDWHVHYPINNYDVSLNIGNYQHFSDQLDDLPLDFYALPEDLEKARKQFPQAKDMLKTFQHYFGEYPFKEDGYKLIQVPYSGMEHQSAVTYGNHFANGYLERDWTGVGISPRFDFIIIHESAHEWFGNAVSAADRSDMWIHEGWATYLECLFVEYMWGKADGLKYTNGYKTKVKNDRPIVSERGMNATPPQDQYFKGALFLNTLRSVIDDDARWFKLIHDYYQQFKYQNIMTEDVVAFFNQQSGMNLTPIFNQYLRHTSIPTLELQFDDSKGAVAYRWKVDEPGFEMPVRVGAPDHWQVIKPTTEWKTMETGMKKDQFEVATDLYFINVTKN